MLNVSQSNVHPVRPTMHSHDLDFDRFPVSQQRPLSLPPPDKHREPPKTTNPTIPLHLRNSTPSDAAITPRSSVPERFGYQQFLDILKRYNLSHATFFAGLHATIPYPCVFNDWLTSLDPPHYEKRQETLSHNGKFVFGTTRSFCVPESDKLLRFTETAFGRTKTESNNINSYLILCKLYCSSAACVARLRTALHGGKFRLYMSLVKNQKLCLPQSVQGITTTYSQTRADFVAQIRSQSNHEFPVLPVPGSLTTSNSNISILRASTPPADIHIFEIQSIPSTYMCTIIHAGKTVTAHSNDKRLAEDMAASVIRHQDLHDDHHITADVTLSYFPIPVHQGDVETSGATTLIGDLEGSCEDTLHVNPPNPTPNDQALSKIENSFSHITEKWYPLGRVTPSINNTENQLLATYHIPDDLFKSNAKLDLSRQNYIFGSYHIEFRIIPAGQENASGSVIFGIQFDNFGSERYGTSWGQLTTVEHVIVDISSNNECLLDCPFVYRRPYIRQNATSFMRHGKFAQLYVVVAQPLTTGVDTTSSTDISIFFRFKDASFGYPHVQGGNSTTAVTKIARFFTDDGVIDGNFGTSVKSISRDSQFTSTMDIARIFGLRAKSAWNVSNLTGTLLTSVMCDPTARALFSSYLGIPTPLEYITSIYNLWRGSTTFKVKFHGTKFHRGSIMAALVPVDIYAATAIPYDKAIAYTNTVFSLGGMDMEFEIDVPFNHESTFARSCHPIHQSANIAAISNPAIGSSVPTIYPYALNLYVVNELISTPLCTDEINISLWWKAGSDYQVRTLRAGGFTSQSAKDNVIAIDTRVLATTPFSKNATLNEHFEPLAIANYPRYQGSEPYELPAGQFGLVYHQGDVASTDETDISKILQRKMFLNAFTVGLTITHSSTIVGGTSTIPPVNIPVRPQTLDYAHSTRSRLLIATHPTAMLLDLFTYWRGSLKYTFILSSEVQGDQVYIMYVPPNGAIIPYNDIQQNIRAGNGLEILSSGNTVCTYIVPYCHENTWMKMHNDSPNAPTYPRELSDTVMGHFELTSITKAKVVVHVSGGPDFEVSNFRGVSPCQARARSAIGVSAYPKFQGSNEETVMDSSLFGFEEELEMLEEVLGIPPIPPPPPTPRDKSVRPDTLSVGSDYASISDFSFSDTSDIEVLEDGKPCRCHRCLNPEIFPYPDVTLDPNYDPLLSTTANPQVGEPTEDLSFQATPDVSLNPKPQDFPNEDVVAPAPSVCQRIKNTVNENFTTIRNCTLANIPVIGLPTVVGLTTNKINKAAETITETVKLIPETLNNTSQKMQTVADKVGVAVESITTLITQATSTLSNLCTTSVSIITNFLLDVVLAAATRTWISIGVLITRLVTNIFNATGFSTAKVIQYAKNIGDWLALQYDSATSIKFQGGEPDSASPEVFLGILAGLVGTITSAVITTKDCASIPKFIFTRFTTSTGISYLNNIINFVKLTFGTISQLFNIVLFKLSPEAESMKNILNDNAAIMAFTKSAQELMCESNASKLTNPVFRTTGWHTVTQAQHLAVILSTVKRTNVPPYLTKIVTDVIKFGQEKFIDLSSSPVRYEPFVICLEGPPGVGKSYLASHLARQLLESIGYNREHSSTIFNRVSGSRFWNNYTNQPVVVYDDWLNMIGKELVSEEISEIYQLKSRATYTPPMADLCDKKIKANPLIVIMCCNNAYPMNLLGQVAAQKLAALRRRDMVFHVDLKPTLKKGGQLVTNVRDIDRDTTDSYGHLEYRQYSDAGDPNSLHTDVMETSNFLDFAKASFQRYHATEVRNVRKELDAMFSDLGSSDELRLKDPFGIFYDTNISDGAMDKLPSEKLSNQVELISQAMKNYEASIDDPLPLPPIVQPPTPYRVDETLPEIRLLDKCTKFNKAVLAPPALNIPSPPNHLASTKPAPTMRQKYQRKARIEARLSPEILHQGLEPIPEEQTLCKKIDCDEPLNDLQRVASCRNGDPNYNMLETAAKLKRNVCCATCFEEQHNVLCCRLCEFPYCFPCGQKTQLICPNCDVQLDSAWCREIIEQLHAVFGYYMATPHKKSLYARILTVFQCDKNCLFLSTIFDNMLVPCRDYNTDNSDYALMPYPPSIPFTEMRFLPNMEDHYSDAKENVSDAYDDEFTINNVAFKDDLYVKRVKETTCKHELLATNVHSALLVEGEWVMETSSKESSAGTCSQYPCDSKECYFNDSEKYVRFLEQYAKMHQRRLAHSLLAYAKQNSPKHLQAIPIGLMPLGIYQNTVIEKWTSLHWTDWKKYINPHKFGSYLKMFGLIAGAIAALKMLSSLFKTVTAFLPGCGAEEEDPCDAQGGNFMSSGAEHIQHTKKTYDSRRITPYFPKKHQGAIETPIAESELKPDLNKLTSLEPETNEDVTLRKIQGNMLRVVFYKNKIVTTCNIVATGIKGRVAIINRHLVDTIERFSSTHQILVYRVGEENKHHIYQYDKTDFTRSTASDLALWKVPASFNMFRDILGMFAIDKDFENIPTKLKIYAPPHKSKGCSLLNTNCHGINDHLTVQNRDAGVNLYKNMLVYDQAYEGLCGAFVLNMRSTRPILAMHCAGVGSGAYTAQGYGTLLTQDALTIPDLINQGDLLTHEEWTGPGLDQARLFLRASSHVNYIGAVEAKEIPFSATKTSIIKSLIHDTTPLLTHTTEPSILTRRDARYTFKDPPLIAGCNKHGVHTVDFTTSELETAGDAVYEMFFMGMNPLVTRPKRLSMEQALVGIPTMADYYGPVKLSTSAGWPFCTNAGKTQKKDYVTFKRDEQQQPYDVEYLDPTVKEMVLKKQEMRRKGIIPLTAFVDTLKDERRKPEKLLSYGGTRVFCSSPIDYTISARQNWLHFNAAFYENRHKLPHAVGINVQGPEWTLLVNNLLKKNKDKFMTLDYTDFGPGFNAGVSQQALNIINRWTIDHVEGVNELELESLAAECQSSLHLMGNTLYQQTSGSPSGAPITTIINSLVNIIYITLAWMHLNEPTSDLFRNFKEHVCLYTYGDDLIMSVTDDYIEKFNTKTISEYFAKHKIVSTNASKQASVIPYDTLANSEFLKRSFVPHELHPGEWLAPLRMTSIIDTTQWMHESPDHGETTVDNCRVALELTHQHGKKTFNHLKKEINTILVSKRLPPTTLSWDILDRTFYSHAYTHNSY